MELFESVGSWWNQNFEQPTIVNRAKVNTLGSQWKNSTGIITPDGPVYPSKGWSQPATEDTGFTARPNIAAPSTAYSGSNFSPIGTQYGAQGIPGYTPAAPVATPVDTNPAQFATYGNPVSKSSNVGGVSTSNDIFKPYGGGSTVNTAGNVPGTANSGWGGFGDTLGNMWEGMGGWQGLQSGLQAATGIFEAYQGMENLDHQKDVFSFQKDAWQANYDMQKDAYDRQVAQVESRKNFLQRGGSQLEENQ